MFKFIVNQVRNLNQSQAIKCNAVYSLHVCNGPWIVYYKNGNMTSLQKCSHVLRSYQQMHCYYTKQLTLSIT